MVKVSHLTLLIAVMCILNAVRAEEKPKSKCENSKLRNCVLCRKYFISFLLFTFLCSVLSCNPANATETTQDKTSCPKGSNCIDNGTASSYCVCEQKFTVNEKFTSSDNNSQYCIEKNETHPTELPPTTTVKATPVLPSAVVTAQTPVKPEPTTTQAPPPTTTSIPKPTTTPEPKASTDKADDVKIKPAVEAHHVLGGILLPIMIVLGFIASVYVFRKYDLIDRVRNRGHQTRYNGLMENDFDDDPLLI